MNKIYKYRLPRDGQVVKVDDYVIEWLTVASQDDLPTAWAYAKRSKSIADRGMGHWMRYGWIASTLVLARIDTDTFGNISWTMRIPGL